MKTFLIVGCMLILTGCNQHLSSQDYETAETLCSNNGKISVIWVGLFGNTVKCANGASFETRKVIK